MAGDDRTQGERSQREPQAEGRAIAKGMGLGLGRV